MVGSSSLRCAMTSKPPSVVISSRFSGTRQTSSGSMRSAKSTISGVLPISRLSFVMTLSRSRETAIANQATAQGLDVIRGVITGPDNAPIENWPLQKNEDKGALPKPGQTLEQLQLAINYPRPFRGDYRAASRAASGPCLAASRAANRVRARAPARINRFRSIVRKGSI